MQRIIKKLVLTLGIASLAAGCNTISATSLKSPETIKVDGSSTVYQITQQVATEFETSRAGKTKVSINASGTGGGFNKFCVGETDIKGASRPILVKEMDACKQAGVAYIELPIAFDAITVAVNP